MLSKQDIEQLQLHLAGMLIITEKKLTDFGRVTYVKPQAILYPDSAKDISVILQFANERKIPVSIRGSAHTTGGQTLSDGIVVDMTSLKGNIEINETESFVETYAGEYWSNIVNQVLQKNLTPPTYSDWLYLTVGGTISTGGVGQRSFRTGCQVDNVLAFEIVMPNGDVKFCSENENTNIFNAARGGLGLFGIITKVRFKLEVAPQQVCVAKLMFTELRDFLAAIAYFVNNEYVDAIQSHSEPLLAARVAKRSGIAISELTDQPENRVYILELTKYIHNNEPGDIEKQTLLAAINHQTTVTPHIFINSFEAHISRVPPILDPDLKDAEEEPEHHHACFFIPFDKAESYLKSEYLKNNPKDDGLGTTLIIPIKKSLIDTRHSLALPDSEFILFIGFLRRQVNNLNTSTKLQQDFERSTQSALAVGGKMYICGSAAPSDSGFWTSHFRQKSHLISLKQQLDPNIILGSSVLRQTIFKTDSSN